ncbi:cysteine dioxygenase family protein [Haloechinothrix sp. LS1_15]|uniref:cysteine dioxygenase n=1 Tax=Haloechinothrix sp. LS1_15 TaxID=2652248 RepID=UPI0029463231|nr:cysteine dioxygenase family protein [Haloechinothrix sp. LS1_15]MDV6013486.1 cupin domain-containing protein [Haloechinothrix sp. LS1_15]
MFAVPANTVVAAAGADVPRHPVRVATEFAADRDRWRDHLRYDPDERFATLISADAEQQVWLMSWLPGQHADAHDHGDTSGAFTVVSGTLTETVLRTPLAGRRGAGDVHELTQGQSRVFGPGYAHRVRNAGDDPAVSIHVYRYGSRTVRPVTP